MSAFVIRNADRLFDIIAPLAAEGLPCPNNAALSDIIGCNPQRIFDYLRDLEHRGRVTLDNTHGRKVQILEGEHKSKWTGVTLSGPTPRARRTMPTAPSPSKETPRPVCLWCEKQLSKAAVSFCTTRCASLWTKHGRGPSKAVVEQRREHISRQPKGCATVEQFLQKGGTVYTEAGYGARA